MFFKDIITEITEEMLKAINKNPYNCPVCHKGILKKTNVIQHYT